MSFRSGAIDARGASAPLRQARQVQPEDDRAPDHHRAVQRCALSPGSHLEIYIVLVLRT